MSKAPWDEQDMSLFGALIQANVDQASVTSNTLHDRALEDALKWAENFRDLISLVYKMNDSMKMDAAISFQFGGADATVDQAIAHFKRMLGRNEEAR